MSPALKVNSLSSAASKSYRARTYKYKRWCYFIVKYNCSKDRKKLNYLLDKLFKSNFLLINCFTAHYSVELLNFVCCTGKCTTV